MDTNIHQLYAVVLIFSHTPREPAESELTYITTTTKDVDPEPKVLPLRSQLASKDGIVLSVVIPCYNETARLEIMLTEAIDHLQRNYANQWEIVIVDDGSKDGTAQFALELAYRKLKLQPGEMRVIQLVENRGKGGAVTHGMQHTRGEYTVFADADGASKFSDVDKLVAAVKGQNDAAVAIGSRAHMVTSDAVVKRSFIRNFLMYSLHTLVFIFGIRHIKDTQCGFKLFNRRAISEIFPYMHTERWIFDVEILIIAIRKHIQILEIPISWHEVEGSKVDLARDSINMAIDLVVTRLAYILGIYNDN